MATSSQPMLDWGKALASLDLTKGAEELRKMLSALQMPGVNMDALVASQRDNLEALTAANRAAMEGMKAVTECQAKILQETMQALAAAMNARTKVTSPQQMIATEAELAKKAFETAVRQMRELADLVTAANRKTADALVKRVPESLDEIKDVLKISPTSGPRKT